MNLKNKLWTEKYRPSTVSEYVFTSQENQEKITHWVNEENIPNLILVGDPGTGKTSLARVLIHDLGIEDYDVLFINASRDNGVDFIRSRIEGFVSTIPFGKFKVVLLDEADYLSQAAQAVLRGLIEEYTNTARFILTGNYAHKIIPALRSRCETFVISKPEKTDFTARAATVLIAENIQFDLDALDSYVSATYPDLRKCLRLLQSNSTGGTLVPVQNSADDQDAMLVEITDMFKSGKILEGRQQLLQFLSLNPSRIEDLYKWMYQNLHLWGSDQQRRDAAVIIIRNGLANLSLVGIPEISLAASIIELTS